MTDSKGLLLCTMVHTQRRSRTSVVTRASAWLRRALYGYAHSACCLMTSVMSTMSRRQCPVVLQALQHWSSSKELCAHSAKQHLQHGKQLFPYSMNRKCFRRLTCSLHPVMKLLCCLLRSTQVLSIIGLEENEWPIYRHACDAAPRFALLLQHRQPAIGADLGLSELCPNTSKIKASTPVDGALRDQRDVAVCPWPLAPERGLHLKVWQSHPAIGGLLAHPVCARGVIGATDTPPHLLAWSS